MLTLDAIFSYLDEAIAQATLQGDRGELRQICQVTAFLAATADEQHDHAAGQRFRRIGEIAQQTLERLG